MLLIDGRPVALDLCQGKRGWTEGLIAAGWYVIGFDVEDWGQAPKHSKTIIQDVRTVDGRKYSGALLAVGSAPGQGFSYRSFPFKRCRELAANVPPDKSIWKACERIAKECGAPLVLENVRGAKKYMGKAAAHYGSFYMWGKVPAVLPIGRPVKGFCHNYEGRTKAIFTGECDRKEPVAYKKMVGSEKHGSSNRKQWSANAAKIPFELAYHIGWCFMNELKGVK